jgi:transcriptional antiterminator RfaH
MRSCKANTQFDLLFSRYLFIQLSLANTIQSWASMRSTLSVSTLFMLGNEPAHVASKLIEMLRARDQDVLQEPVLLHKAGDKLQITEGPFAGPEASHHMDDGDDITIVLIDILSRPIKLNEPMKTFRKSVKRYPTANEIFV